jgi:multiple sugar transport system ATP-binding protein
MAVLRYENVTKKYGRVVAVDNMSFDTKDGEFLVILGPSGAGKTTTLKIACGLVNPNEGNVLLDGENITKQPPYKRDIAITFENYALYPHMTVFDNMAYPLRSVKGRYSEEQIRDRVVGVATMLHIDPLLERFPAEASGGQKQRIALGRTMVRKPKVYLLDEPLAHLDAKIRVELREEFHKIEELKQATTIYVTHDYTEALSLGDRIMILQKGKVLQVDAPDDIYYRPISLEVARQVGQPAINVIYCDVKRKDSDFILQSQKSPAVQFQLLERHRKIFDRYGKESVILGIRPKDVGITPVKDGSQLKAVVDVFQPLGSEGVLTTSIDDEAIVGLIDPTATVRHEERITLYFETKFFYFFDYESKNNLELL